MKNHGKIGICMAILMDQEVRGIVAQSSQVSRIELESHAF